MTVVLLPPSHKHTLACIAEAATIIFTRSSLLGRAAESAEPARRLSAARQPGNKLNLFVSSHVLIFQL